MHNNKIQLLLSKSQSLSEKASLIYNNFPVNDCPPHNTATNNKRRQLQMSTYNNQLTTYGCTFYEVSAILLQSFVVWQYHLMLLYRHCLRLWTVRPSFPSVSCELLHNKHDCHSLHLHQQRRAYSDPVFVV